MRAGYDGEAFWRFTLREIRNILDGYTERLADQHNERAWLAWHIEALARQKKLPKLKSMMHGAGSKTKRRQTIEEQLAIAVQWTKALANKR